MSHIATRYEIQSHFFREMLICYKSHVVHTETSQETVVEPNFEIAMVFWQCIAEVQMGETEDAKTGAPQS